MVSRKIKPVLAKNMNLVQEAIKDGGKYSILDIAFSTGLCRPTVERAMHFLHAAAQVHICDWGRVTECNLFKIYTIGPGKDADRPPPLPKSEANKLYKLRRRLINQKAKLDAELAKPAFRHPQDIALFGDCKTPLSREDAFKVHRHYITIDEDELEAA
jgi:hypothetical protein